MFNWWIFSKIFLKKKCLDESEDDTPVGQSAGPNTSNNADDDDDDDEDYTGKLMRLNKNLFSEIAFFTTGLSLLSGDFLEDILGDGDDDESSSQNRPIPARKNKNKKKKVPVTESESQNEVDGVLNDGEDEEEAPATRPVARPVRDEDDDDDDDDGKWYFTICMQHQIDIK